MPDEVLTLMHGGAGPADFSGERFDRGMATLNEIYEEWKTNDQFLKNFSPYLSGPMQPRSITEVASLSFVKALEACAFFNAGRGAALQEDGVIRVSASFMESERQKFSAVMNVENVLHPSEMAFLLQMKRFCVLDARGAQNLAREVAVPLDDLLTEERFEKWVEFKRQGFGGEPQAGETGTVGCVSVSPLGNLAACTSTGGVSNETPGRIGDTPTVAGNYASRRVAISCTGVGEQIVNQALAARIAVRIDDGMSLNEALERSLKEAEDQDHRLALIAVSFDEESKKISWAAGTTNAKMMWKLITPPDFELSVDGDPASLSQGPGVQAQTNEATDSNAIPES